MFRELLQNPLALALSVLGHIVLVVVLLISIEQQSTPALQARVEPVKALAVDEALANAPDKDEPFFKVPKVLGDGGGA